jgi:hypothetical protein
MKHSLLFIFLTVTLTILYASVFAESNTSKADKEKVFEYSVNAGFFDKYTWRGITYNNGLVFQPEFTVSAYNFYISTWANVTIFDRDELKSNELDFILGYSLPISDLTIDAYFSYFIYFEEENGPNTGELTLSASYPLGDFSVYASTSADLIEATGAMWFEAGVGYEKELSERINLSTSLSVGGGNNAFNNYYLEVDKFALNVVTANIASGYLISENIILEPSIGLNFFPDKQIRAATEPFTYLLGLSLNIEF